MSLKPLAVSALVAAFEGARTFAKVSPTAVKQKTSKVVRRFVHNPYHGFTPCRGNMAPNTVAVLHPARVAQEEEVVGQQRPQQPQQTHLLEEGLSFGSSSQMQRGAPQTQPASVVGSEDVACPEELPLCDMDGPLLFTGSSCAVPAVNVRYVVVQFKHELCTFVAPFRVSAGDAVIAEADRGEHLGRVHAILDAPPAFSVPSRILRRASPAEAAAVEDFREREGAAVLQMQKITDNLGLPLRIVDAEFYLDGNKMTVFFASKTAVDFRKLQRSLFRQFRCRIWLINFSEVQYRNRNFRNRK